jgi:hypothetical protein
MSDRNYDPEVVKERLRPLNHKCEEQWHDNGCEAGKKWAANKASIEELRTLSAKRAQVSSGWANFFLENRGDAPAKRFVQLIQPGPENGQGWFWANNGLNGSEPQGHFVAGFAKGALEVWDAVKGELGAN